MNNPKLIVQIPCFNEEHTLARTIADIPRTVNGIGQVQVLVIDDGCTDDTVRVARESGADFIVHHKTRLGLARAFSTGLDEALRHGADIIVNFDGDNQYVGADIPRLVDPILRGRADIVIGDRQTRTNPLITGVRRLLQQLGSAVVRQLSGLKITDAVSGFRAFSREAALQLNVVTSFSYTIETVIQAGKRQIAIASVPVRTNAPTRKSRLFKRTGHFLAHSLITMIRVYAMYKPMRMFFYIGSVALLIGVIPIIRFLFAYSAGNGAGHVQSLVLGGAFLVMAVACYLIGFLADLTSINRQLLESTLEKVRRMELRQTNPATSLREEPREEQRDSAIARPGSH